jgi:hypothetical protein
LQLIVRETQKERERLREKDRERYREKERLVYLVTNPMWSKTKPKLPRFA